MKAVYPGSFDPLTRGHLDIIKRASKVFSDLTILVSDNPHKNSSLDVKSRSILIQQAIKDSGLQNIKIDTHSGLVVDYAKNQGFGVILRGIRAASDFEMELEMSQVNQSLSGIETMFLMTDPKYSFIRASRVWELLRFGGDIDSLVPENVAEYLRGEGAK